MSDFAWLIEGPNESYLGIFDHNRTFIWTKEHAKAMRFARQIDAGDAMMIAKTYQPELFDNGRWERTKPVEHGWLDPQAASRPSPGFAEGLEAAARMHDADAITCEDKANYGGSDDSDWAQGWKRQAEYHRQSADQIRALTPEPIEQKVERVARAIAGAGCGNGPSVPKWIDENWPNYVEEARAAIAAMNPEPKP